MSGTEFLAQVARDHPHQRRLMLSGRFQSEEVARAMDRGAVHRFMMKPWDDAILKAEVRESFRQLQADLAVDETLEQLGSGLRTQRTESAAHRYRHLTRHSVEQNRLLTRELHKAVRAGRLSLQYQPQVDLCSGEVSGFEGLLRWNSSIGPIGPDRFTALAERSGSITELTGWVVGEVCYRASRWSSARPQIRLSLNVSPLDLRGDSLLQCLQSALAEHRLCAGFIQVEVTESSALDVDGHELDVLNALAKLGVGLAIDDFGAGATSMAYLAQLPFSTVKIDRSLVLQLDTARGRKVMQKLIELCTDLEMHTTVEGVESLAHLDLIKGFGASTVQGYIYSKPLPVDGVEQWLASGGRGVPS